MLLTHYRIEPDEIEKEFGVIVGEQLETIGGAAGIGGEDGESYGRRRMSDEEYFRRYGKHRGETANFLAERR